MGGHNPVPDNVRDAITAELRYPQDPPRSRAEIARHHGVSARTVSRYAEAAGIDPEDAWRTDTIAAATQAATDRRRAQRSEIADELQRRALELLGKLDEPFLAFAFGGKDNEYNEHVLPGPPTGDIKNLMTSTSLALQRALDIDKVDTDSGDGASADTLERLFGGLDTAYLVLKNNPPEPAE